MDLETKFILIIMTLAVLISSIFKLPGIINYYSSDFNNFKIIKVEVTEGDSLWKIAKSVSKEKDPRITVEKIKEINGLSSYEILPGQVLLVPVKEDSLMAVK